MRTNTGEKLQCRDWPRWTALATGMLMVAVAVAAWFSRLASRYDGDSFLPVMMSLQRLTVYYWAQNRFGNLLPLLASGVRDVEWNFQLQALIRALGTASVPLLGLVFLGVRKRLFAAYALALGLMLLPFSDEANFLIWLDTEPYGQSALLLLGALLLYGGIGRGAPGWRNAVFAAGALALATGAFFVNSSLVIFVLPLWAGAAVMTGARRDWSFVGLLAVAFVLGNAPTRWFGHEYHAGYNYAQINFDFANFSSCAATVVSMASGWLLLCCIIVTLCGLCLIQRRRGGASPAGSRWKLFARVDPLVWRAALMLIVAGFYLALVSNMGWVKLNSFAFRYFMFPLMFVPVVCAGVTMQALLPEAEVRSRAGKIVVTGAALAVMVTVILQKLTPFGRENLHLEASHREDAMAVAQVAREYGASFVAGDYFLVWPSVFYTMHLRQEAGDPGALRVYGMAPKGEVLRAVYAEYLRSAPRIVAVGAGKDVKDCYEILVHNDCTDWPARVSLVKRGTLPSGGTYCVLVFERDTPGEAPAPQAGTISLPAPGAVMLHMMRIEPAVAHWEGEQIKVAAGGPERLVIKGPYANLPTGKYRVSFAVETQGKLTPEVPLLEIDAQDYLRDFARRVVHVGELEQRDGTAWASLDFEVPANAPTENLDFSVATFGTIPFVVKDFEVRPAQ